MPASYDILQHGTMIGDERRLDAYLEAIRRAVRPGDVVVDLGSGTGVFAVAACRAGARRVYAIEADGIVQVARDVVAANHCTSRVEFVEELSTHVTLPERADVVVLDVRGVLPDEIESLSLSTRGDGWFATTAASSLQPTQFGPPPCPSRSYTIVV